MYKKLSTSSNISMKKLTRMFFPMGFQYWSPYVFNLSSSTALPEKRLSWYWNELCNGKNPIDGIGWTVKNVVFKKGKLVNSPLEFSEAVTKFVLSIHSVPYLKMKILSSQKIWVRLKRSVKRWKHVSWKENLGQSGDTYITFFKIADDEDPLWGENEIISDLVETSKIDDQCQKCLESYNEREEWLCCPVYHNDKKVFME